MVVTWVLRGRFSQEYDVRMDAHTAPHSYYPTPDVWEVTTAGDERSRHDEWERSDPNMVALAQAMTVEMVVAGESFANGWSSPR